LWLVVSSYLGEHWQLPVLLALAGVALAFIVRRRSTATFTLTFLVLSALTSSFVIWAAGFGISQDLSVNPVLRMVLVAVVVLCPLTGIMFEDAWRAGGASVRDDERRSVVGTRRVPRTVAWCVLVGSALVYPASAMFGIPGPTLPGGRPSFPEPPPSLTALIELTPSPRNTGDESSPNVSRTMATVLADGPGVNQTNGCPGSALAGRSCGRRNL
jgi:hypothetical protein